jgi:hypothetical protein
LSILGYSSVGEKKKYIVRSFIMCRLFFNKYYYGDEIKEHEIGEN